MTTETPLPPTPPSAPATSPEAAPAVAVAPVTPKISIDDFMKTELRVARIVHAEPVPKSKKLLKLQVDVGPTLGTRQILSGIALFYTPESLIGRKIIIVANLTPAKLMGLESQGMLLAASSEDGSKLLIVDPGADMPEGSIVR